MKISTKTSQVFKMVGKEAGIRMICDAGFDAIDLSLFEMTRDAQNSPFNSDGYREHTRWLRTLANERGVEFNQAHAPYELNFADPEIYRNTALPLIKRSIEIAAIAGAPNIVVHPLHHIPYAGHERELHEKNIEYYAQFIPLCEEYGIKVAVENMWGVDPYGRFVDDVGSRPEALAALVDELNAIAPCFTACLDIGHTTVVQNQEPQDFIRALGADRLGCLHVHDNDYRGDQHWFPGLGKLDWPAVTDALRDIGYRGDFTLEADVSMRRFTPDVLPIVLKFMAGIARHWADKCV